MKIERLAAFSDGNTGGNPAGVVLEGILPDEAEMQRIAAEVGYSETAFVAAEGSMWRVRYFAPELEVPFCGHATIAVGAVLASRFGDGLFTLQLNNQRITVEGKRIGAMMAATLQSPPTKSMAAPAELVAAALELLAYAPTDLDTRIPPGLAEAGGRHLVLGLQTRQKLAALEYQLAQGRHMMLGYGLTTINLIYAETPRLFHSRNAFASGGVYEDPATGAAAAALGGYLRDLEWPHEGRIDIIQGEDMGMRSKIRVEITPARGESVRVSGTARIIEGRS